MFQNIKKDEKVVLIDGNALMYRAYYGLGKSFNPIYEGNPAGMVYGFGSILINILETLDPGFIAVTFDTKDKTFRHRVDESYKANRKKAPDDFYLQVPLLEEMIIAFGVPVFKKAGFESDDLIGSLSKIAEKRKKNVFIVSGDMDFCQIVSDRIRLIVVRGKINSSPVYGPKEVRGRYGVDVGQIVDFKSLAGDSSDNYLGVPGIGPKTAKLILNRYGSLDYVLKNIDDIDSKFREKIRDSQDKIRHCQFLARIKTDISFESLKFEDYFFNFDRANSFFQKVGFRALSSRLQKLIKKSDQNNFLDQKNSTKFSIYDKQMKLF